MTSDASDMDGNYEDNHQERKVSLITKFERATGMFLSDTADTVGNFFYNMFHKKEAKTREEVENASITKIENNKELLNKLTPEKKTTNIEKVETKTTEKSVEKENEKSL